jgi:hypothetical protein
MTDHWTAQNAAELADKRMTEAERLLERKDFRNARSEMNLAKFHLMNAERMAKKSGVELPGYYRSTYRRLMLKLRLRDHILNLLGF